MNTKQLIRRIVRPREAIMSLNTLLNSLRRDEDYNPMGVDIMEEDWDTLIILDACRYDVFAERHNLPGELQHRVSRGGATVEFLRGNFRGRQLHDTVYVTATPQISRLQVELDVSFHDIIDVWKNRWDDSIQNVPPEAMTEAAREAVEKYPDKRIIIHYNQPHGPFLGPTAKDLVIGPNRDSNQSLLDFAKYEFKHELVDADEWKAGLCETFDITQEHVADLLTDLEGRTVVTSDHGEMLGERAGPIPISYCGHQIGIYHDALVKVPWLVHESGERREIVSEESHRKRDVDYSDKTVGERLRDLGYVG